MNDGLTNLNSNCEGNEAISTGFGKTTIGQESLSIDGVSTTTIRFNNNAIYADSLFTLC